MRDAGRAEGPLIERANLRTGLSSDSVQSVLEDRDGNIWVGTTGGLHRLQERALTPVENVGFVVAMEPAEGARMWAGTTNGMIQFSGAPGPWARMGARSPGPDVRIAPSRQERHAVDRRLGRLVAVCDRPADPRRAAGHPADGGDGDCV